MATREQEKLETNHNCCSLLSYFEVFARAHSCSLFHTVQMQIKREKLAFNTKLPISFLLVFLSRCFSCAERTYFCYICISDITRHSRVSLSHWANQYANRVTTSIPTLDKTISLHVCNYVCSFPPVDNCYEVGDRRCANSA